MTTTIGWTISETVEQLRRYAYTEHACVRALAGWFLRTPRWETKLRLGYLLYAHAERAYELQGRLEELRGGNRDVNLDPGYEQLCEQLVHAQGPDSFLAGLQLMYAQLEGAYSEFVRRADSAANALDIRVLRRHADDVQRGRDELAALRAGAAGEEPGAAGWVGYLSGLLEAAGGIAGKPPADAASVVRPADVPLFPWPSSILFDERIRHGDLGSYEGKLNQPMEERRIGEFQVYFNEFYAAALLATVIYDSWKLSAPRQYFMDIAHHFWDEVRHAEFGAIRLREIGVEPSVVNMLLFDQSRKMPLLHRFCYLTLGLEIYFMPRKSVRVRYYGEQGDARSQLFADIDWSEEVNHVRYGKKWIDHFLEDDHRTVEDLQQEIIGYLDGVPTELAVGQKAPW
ncbi:hypothetical protein [Paenibacillus koleovorans]|uniref:hypothetical protein n=1 Tax=Paenibacillus koleovorans TaxID=121608 RepID=UPI000FDC2D45|nr:hypothetical protein [Paenibacillus koleovorans]